MADRQGSATTRAEERLLGRATPGQPSFWERAVAAVAAILVAALFGFLIWQAFTARDAAPRIAFRVGEVQSQAQGFLVPFEAVNEGTATASAVEVVGQLRLGEAIEESRVTIDYLPAASYGRGGLWFRQDPRQGELVLRAIGYLEP